jgi:hypothetical protein
MLRDSHLMLAKNIPKNIPFDREKLYDKSITLQKYATFLLNENIKLKAKMRQFEV